MVNSPAMDQSYILQDSNSVLTVPDTERIVWRCLHWTENQHIGFYANLSDLCLFWSFWLDVRECEHTIRLLNFKALHLKLSSSGVVMTSRSWAMS